MKKEKSTKKDPQKMGIADYKKQIRKMYPKGENFYVYIELITFVNGEMISLNPFDRDSPDSPKGVIVMETPGEEGFLPKDVIENIKKNGLLELTGEDIVKIWDFKGRKEFLIQTFSKKTKFRRSGHLTDQILKYDYPKDKNYQLSIFDTLENKESIKQKIEKVGAEITQIVEGIKLSPSETKIIDCLCRLLHKSSQTLEPDRPDYYTGNLSPDITLYGGEETPAPKLAFTPYELTREYKGGEYVAGKDIENVKQILKELDKKRFLLSYLETTWKKDGGRIETKIEDFVKLIHIVKMTRVEYNREDVETSKRQEAVILLNPIFRRQIDSKFILYPADITRRTIIAYGSHNISEIALRLRDYLMRELSNKRYDPEVGLDRLYYILAEKWMREGRKKKVKEYVDKAIETVISLGLLLSYEIKPTSTGEPKIVFTLNENWE